MILILMIIMAISQIIRCIYNIAYLVGITDKNIIPLISSLYYIISSFIYLLIIVMTAGIMRINQYILTLIFFVEPILVIITGILVMVKQIRFNKSIKKVNTISIILSMSFFIAPPFIPIIDMILISFNCNKRINNN